MIRRKGTLVSFGNASGVVDPVPLFKLTAKNIKLLRPTYVLCFLDAVSLPAHPYFFSVTHYLTTLEEREFYGSQLFDLISKGDLKINIFADYPFTAEGVRQAQSDLTGGKTTGKVLIKVADE